MFTLAAAAYNLVRFPKLLEAPHDHGSSREQCITKAGLGDDASHPTVPFDFFRNLISFRGTHRIFRGKAAPSQ